MDKEPPPKRRNREPQRTVHWRAYPILRAERLLKEFTALLRQRAFDACLADSTAAVDQWLGRLWAIFPFLILMGVFSQSACLKHPCLLCTCVCVRAYLCVCVCVWLGVGVSGQVDNLSFQFTGYSLTPFQASPSLKMALPFILGLRLKRGFFKNFSFSLKLFIHLSANLSVLLAK